MYCDTLVRVLLTMYKKVQRDMTKFSFQTLNMK